MTSIGNYASKVTENNIINIPEKTKQRWKKMARFIDNASNMKNISRKHIKRSTYVCVTEYISMVLVRE